MGLWHTDGSPNISQKTRTLNNLPKKSELAKLLTLPFTHRIKLKECEKNKYFDLPRELKKTMKYEVDNYTNCDWCFWYSS